MFAKKLSRFALSAAVAGLAFVTASAVSSGSASAAEAQLIYVKHGKCHGGKVYSWRKKRCVCRGRNVWIGRRCVSLDYHDGKGRLLPGYKYGKNGAVQQDNGGGE